MSYEYKLPSLGDGVSGKITEILVKPGDTISKDQVVVVVGTDKVDAEMPSDADGVVEEVLVKKGDDVTEGSPILRIAETAASAAEKTGAETETAASAAEKTGADTKTTASAAKKNTPDTETEAAAAENKATRTAPATAETPDTNRPAAEAAATSLATGTSPAAEAAGTGLRASPLARKRAKEFGINLTDVHPADSASRISYKDVLDFVKKRIDTGGGSIAPGAGLIHKQLPDFEKFGTVIREAQSRIGVITAENMVYAFNAIPHAWISEKADITRLEQLRQQYKEQVKTAGGNLTTTAILAKAVCTLLRKMPQFNASYDPESREIIFKKYYNVGIAVDTPRGLLVPVIRNTDQKSLTEISAELAELSTRTREGKNKPDDLDGGTFSISNIGGIGGTNMISIVNWPQVAILSITAAAYEPRWNGNAFEPRLMLPMTIGWDHRVINGADAARFLRDLKGVLEEPFLGWM